MKHRLTFLLLAILLPLAALAFVTTTACVGRIEPAAAAPVERGRYLVESCGGAACHTPLRMGDRGPEPDLARAYAGHPEGLDLPPAPAAQGPWMVSVAATNTAWAGPWGVSFTANLTPDAETGLGRWSEQQFVDAMRNGRHEGSGRQILPPMPIPALAHMTEPDLRAVFAYLRSLPPIRNRVPEPRPAPDHP